ncbi:MAG: phosphoribosylaminoimidazolesuccinocarboxamide synthase [Ignavibacteria bacterium]
MLVKKVDIIKVEVVFRNVAAGSLVKRNLVFEEEKDLEKPIIEYYLKSDELGDPLFTDEHIYALGLANKSELDVIRKMALFINDLLIKIL